MTPDSNPVSAFRLSKNIDAPAGRIDILQDVNLELGAGEAVAILGASGSGKSTLLGLLAGLDDASGGKIKLFGEDLSQLDEDGRAALRAGRVGFVFQSFQLLPGMTALENVMLPLELAGESKPKPLAEAALSQVELSQRLHHYPSQLSGGEQQRVAIARAFATRPLLLFADEPTGSLDQATGERISDLIFQLRSETGAALLLVTHDVHLAARCDRRLQLQHGSLGERLMTAVGFALRLFRRDWHNSELRLLALSLMLSVAAVTAVGFFTDRVGQAMELQAGESLAADLVLSSHNPIPDDYRIKAAALGLKTAEVLGFPSAVLHGERTQLVIVKAVSPGYPLRGELRIRQGADAAEQIVQRIPQAGEIWVEAQLLAALDLTTGGRLSLGEKEFLISGVISRDTGEASNMFRLGPSVLLSLAEIPATGLVTPASRVHHRLLIAGDQAEVADYRKWAEAHPAEGIRLSHMSNARPALRSALDRGSRFLGLAALVTVLIASTAVALSSRRFVERQSDASAILRCLGASRSFLLRVLSIRLLLLAMAASLIGLLLGYAAQLLLAALVGEWFTTDLPSPSPAPLAIGIGTGLITLLGFTLPAVVRLGSVPPLRVLRRDLKVTPTASWILGLCAFSALALLMLWQAREAKLALLVLAGTLLSLALLLSAARLLVAILTPLRHHSGAIWRYGLVGLARNPVMTSLQMTGFGLGILALLLLTLVRVDLLATWERTIPTQAPNQFLINIQPDAVAPLKDFLLVRTAASGGIYPMLRARLTHINDRPISLESYQDEDAQRLVAREFNLSHAMSMQPDNRIVAGRWWREAESEEPLFSVEQGLAKKLGIQLDDNLSFDLAGSRISGRVSNLRTVRWDSFRPNFFIIATPGLLRDYPTSFITSFYLEPGREKILSDLIREFPSITVIDVGALMQQIREIMARGSIAIEYVFLFTLAAGMLLLYAGIQSSREHRRQESAILRTLGLSRSRLLLATGIEFLVLGLLAGALASLCASLIGLLIAEELFALDYRFNPWLWLTGTLSGGLGVALAGVVATYPFVVHPPLHILREA